MSMHKKPKPMDLSQIHCWSEFKLHLYLMKNAYNSCPNLYKIKTNNKYATSCKKNIPKCN